MHAAQPLAQALMRKAQVSAILLPQMVTLNEWAQSVPLDVAVASDSQRSAMLYQQLRKLQWFENADLWSMTQELLKLFDELTHALHALPEDADAFAAAVQQAYQARQNTTLQLEARLVFELWHAMQSGEELDAARAYQMRLAKLAQQADRPLYVLRASEWDALEQRFLEEYEQRAMVKVFDVREMEVPSQMPLFFAATSLEQEARAAAMQVRRWLAEGKRNIAIVAQDRVAARRTRALLERAEILVADETGWTFATLSVSTVLDRWLTALQSDFYHHDLLDLLKSPYIFADMTAGERKATVYQLEQLLRKQGVVAGLENFVALTAQEVSLHQPLARLRQAAALLEQNRKHTLAQWLAALQKSLNVLGIDSGLQQDDAGQQLLRALQNWQQELHGDEGPYHFAEWRRWLAQQLDTETFRDSSIDSPVRFTHLAATRWRRFDAVLMLGCDAAHLPSAGDGGRWFNDAVRSTLNLPTRAFHAVRQHDDLRALLAMNDEVLVTWQKEQNGEARLLSPFLQMLRDAHKQAQGDDLSARELPAYLAAEDAQHIELPASTRPVPSVASDSVPASISISGYNTLVACPYQYYARHILKLNELDEVQEAIEKRDYGECVHGILQRFHEQYPLVMQGDLAEMEAALQRISEEVFADLLAHDFTAQAWLARWVQSLPAYLDWQIKREREGWRYAESEQAFDWPLDGIRLRGRIDRLDVRGEEKLVLDYKTQSDQLLRNKLKEPGEDVQLACYAYAHEAADAAFVSIESGKVKQVAPQEDVPLLAQLNAERLEQVMGEIRGGAGLPANGIDAVCGYCEMRGVCRKGEWQ
ncbi:MAG: PD-(D/E)XK nuclease family protein [Gammaproteobacteria bacterium]|nr:PD-(D/E)XK nuclease family protein [Gammaproteobacteria bacterium]MBU1624910.1 PD-(D/E)XK nuclease family protein [Gammaproteobacteria bacterium]MBU1982754.1 PD-(D/E)XK nuclease family protein [Gammaproteobacteria bacterium]